MWVQKMKIEFRNVYLHELRSQCILARQAVEDMGALLADAPLNEQAPRFWYCLQAFLAAAANISKLLWPSESHAAERGSELRTFLGIDDDSPLRVRRLRNDIEHLDSRLDDWVRVAEADGNLALAVRIIEGGSTGLVGLDPKRCFLFFDASTYCVTVAGQVYELLPICWAITTLAEKVDEVLDTPPWKGGLSGHSAV
jgi:hypothetical protein